MSAARDTARQDRIKDVLSKLWEMGGLYFVKGQPIDPEPARARNRAVEQAMAELAGLLADPADRDEQHIDLTPVADIIRDAQAYRDETGITFKPESAASDLFSAGWLAGRSERLARERAEAEVERITLSYAENNRAWEKYRKRAEAEVAGLHADCDRRGERLWRLAAMAGHEPSESDNDATAEHSIASALAERAELRATVERVRALHPPHVCDDWRKCQIVFGGQCCLAGECSVCRRGYPCPTIRALDPDGGA